MIRMMGVIDYFLDRITMYRLVLYYLIGLLVIAFLLSFFGVFSFSPVSLLLSTALLLAVGLITNKVFAYVFGAPTNVESVYISVLIVALIFNPIQSLDTIVPIAWVAVWTMASKYIFAIGKKHLFNPVAIAAVITYFTISESASWWVGNAFLMPFVVAGGILIVRKMRRLDLVFSFFITAVITIFFFTIMRGGDLITTLKNIALYSSLFFFAFVMLTEPLTTPPTKTLQILYGGFVGILFAPQIQITGIFSTPELALVVGNLFSYLVSPKQKLVLFVEEKEVASANVVDFLFVPNKKMSFSPGQYLEWTLQHPKTDSRGNRRYFTIASSPTEEMLRIGVKFYEKGSSYKQALSILTKQIPIVGAQLAGDFILPKDTSKKFVFIAGGIGITPYRSMIKYVLDTKQSRSIVLLYANKHVSEIAYRDVLDQAAREMGIKTVYTLTDKESVPSDWQGRVGRIDATMIAEEVPDYKDRLFYLSGPQMMITATKKVLKEIGINEGQIKTDYFPGLV